MTEYVKISIGRVHSTIAQLELLGLSERADGLREFFADNINDTDIYKIKRDIERITKPRRDNVIKGVATQIESVMSSSDNKPLKKTHKAKPKAKPEAKPEAKAKAKPKATLVQATYTKIGTRNIKNSKGELVQYRYQYTYDKETGKRIKSKSLGRADKQ